MLGGSIGDWRKTWVRATETAGLRGKLFHDLRRTVARNLVRSGVPERGRDGRYRAQDAEHLRPLQHCQGGLRHATTRLAECMDGQPANGRMIPLSPVAEGVAR